MKLTALQLVVLLGLAVFSASQTCTVTNCVTCPTNNGTVCDACATSYTLSENTCISCNVNNCDQCLQSNTCNRCDTGYSLIASSNSCFQCNVQRCAFCSSPNLCSQCNNDTQTYFPSFNRQRCVTCSVGNCNFCTTNNNCTVCANGYQKLPYLNQRGINVTCIMCNVANCQYCSAVGVCGKCITGYSLSSQGTCFTCRSPCATCTNTGTCATCQTPLYYRNPQSNGTCVAKTVPNCQAFAATNTARCGQCETGYTLNTAGTTCSAICHSSCLTCSGTAANQCLTCDEGFALTSSNTCESCSDDACISCPDGVAVCTACTTGFYLQNDGCVGCPQFCTECVSSTECVGESSFVRQTVVQINGESSLANCPSNCIECVNTNPEFCSQCDDGLYRTQSGFCQLCDQNSNCQTCDESDPTICLTCFTGTYLQGNICVNCDDNCLTCLSASQPATCTSCDTGQGLSSTNTCVTICSEGCISCSSSTQCDVCDSGYALFLNLDNSITCENCLSDCRICAPFRPTTCLDCGSGRFSNNGICQSCSSNCESCRTADVCLDCYDGYYLTRSFTCAENCISPCATCLTTDPTVCRSCVAGYTYNSQDNSCTPNLDCSGGCQFCPSGYSLLESQQSCVQCQQANCQKCNPQTPEACTSCQIGYYLTRQDTCTQCPQSCRACTSNNRCSLCASGYTLTEQSTRGRQSRCLACTGRCLTCTVRTQLCLTCKQGFILASGWKCFQQFNFEFEVTLLTDIDTFNLNYRQFLAQLSAAVDSADRDVITLDSWAQGSIVVQGKMDPTAVSGSDDAKTQLDNVGNTLAQNAFVGNMKIAGSSVTVNGGTVASGSSTDIAIILGISIPLGILLVLGVIFFVVYQNKKRKSDIYKTDGSNGQYESRNSATQKKFDDDNSLI